MQLFIGGAFSGKRKIVKEKIVENCWLSSYQGDLLEAWKVKWKKNSTLVLEGWEKWLSSRIKLEESDERIRNEFQSILQLLKEEELKRADEIVLIMLEVGRGIVPISKDERRLRDLAGWILQDATELADEVNYVWHGLSKRLK